MARIMVVVGHSQAATFCGALGRAYEEGAKRGGHDVTRFELSDMSFDPILRGGDREVQPLEPDLKKAYDSLVACNHLVLIFPLRFGDMPAILKGFIERILQPDLVAHQNTESAMNWNIFPGKTARIIVTMAMPVSIYRWWFGAHAVRLLKRNILNFIGIKPVRDTLYGMIETSTPERRERWLNEVKSLGQSAI